MREDQASGLRKLVAQDAPVSDRDLSEVVEKNSKFITVASGKGGVGKTNFAVNFAYILANEFQKRVLLIDADIGMANIHLFLNIEPKKSIKDLFFGESIENIVYHAHGFDTLLGFSGIEDIFEMEEVSIQSIVTQLDKISSRYDYVIIDTGAGIDHKVSSFLRASDKAYIVTTPEPTALMDAYALIKSMYNIYGYENFKMVVNMCKNEEEGELTFNNLKISAHKFLGIDLDLMGILPLSPNVPIAVKNKELIALRYPKDPYTQNIKRICEKELRIDKEAQSNGFWKKLFEMMGQK